LTGIKLMKIRLVPGRVHVPGSIPIDRILKRNMSSCIS
jgi:hypothetical protein